MTPVTVIVFLLVMGWTSFPWTAQFIYWRMGMFTALFSIIGMLVFLETFATGERERGVWRSIMLSCTVVFLGIQWLPGSSLSQYAENRMKVADASLVFAASEAITQNDSVVADPQTAMVLYAKRGLVVYNGAPVSPAPSFPASLFSTSKTGKTYLLLGKRVTPELFAFAKSSGVTLTTLQENSTYGFYEVK